MAGASGLIIILMGVAIAIVLMGGTIALLVYGIATGNPRRGFIASVIALALSLLSALLSSPIWALVLSGHDTHGNPWHFSEIWAAVVLLAVEALAILASLLGVARQRSRRGRAAV